MPMSILPEETIHQASIAVLDPARRLLEWNAAFEREFAGTGIAIRAGLMLEALELAATGEDESRSAADDAEAGGQAGHIGMARCREGRRYLVEEAVLPSGRRVRSSREIAAGLAASDEESRLRHALAIQTAASVTRLRRAAREELRCAREAAERANRAKGDFLATVSHELRTPLNAILGMTELLLRTPLSPEQAGYAAAAARSGEILMNIINDVLDLSKIEAGKLDLKPCPFDLVELVEGAAGLVAVQAAEKGLHLAVFIAPELRTGALGDAQRLHQVLLNLIGNAAKFTQSGQIRVEVHPMAVAGSGARTLQFSIADTGIGIPPAAQQRLFRRFEQADPSISRRYGGSGLGLAICGDLIALMGGRIGIDSLPGQGTTAWFELPLPAAPTTRRWHLSPALAGARVLVVGADPEGARFCAGVELCRHLDALGLSPYQVADANHAARELAQARSRDMAYRMVFVTDPAMPAAGLALPAELKLVRPVLLLAPEDAARMPCPPWADRVLVRPIRLQPLLDCLRRIEPALPWSPAVQGSIGGNGPERRPLQVLVAEDNEMSLRMMDAFLQQARCKVDLVRNGRDAVAAAERQVYDLVLMDLRMPEMDGLEAARRIRALPVPFNGPHILAVTADALGDVEARCGAAGMDDYLAKPVRLSSLQEKLDRLQEALAEAEPRESLMALS